MAKNKEPKTIKISTTMILLFFIIVGTVAAISFMKIQSQQMTTKNVGTSESARTNTGSLKNTITQVKEKNCEDVQVPYDDIEYYTEKEPYSVEECEQEPYSYAIENFIGGSEERNCNWMGLNCDHYYSCSLDIVNHEDKGGTFELQPYIISDQRGQINKPNIQQYVYAESQKTVSFEELIGKDEGARCYYNIKSIPTKQICNTVTKYKTVQKTRTVTKWRTETRCD